jgi:FMN phosphatase YigB (HAD superfamily)
VLNALRPNYQLFIGSNSDDIPLHTDIERNGIEVNKVFTSESLKVYKPKKEFYLFILDEIKMRYDEVLFVGDSLIDDVSGPAALGIKTIWLNYNNITYDQNDYKPLYEINNLNQLLEISF